MGDSLHVENYDHDTMTVIQEVFIATGRMFEQEHLRMVAMITASNFGAVDDGGVKYNKGIMEHRVVQGLNTVSGDIRRIRGDCACCGEGD